MVEPTNGQHTLSPEHESLLRGSAVLPEVISARGYWTATSADTDRVRFDGHSSELVRHGSALMLPLHDVHGHIALTVARPDVPRLDAKGKPRKYEIPRGARATLDVPPTVRAALQDPEVRLWVTEGQRKGDAAVSAGAGCVIALLGVWMWKKFSLPAWDAVVLSGRTVYLAFDSDATTNPKVQQALRRLKAFLGSKGAHVRIVHLDSGPGGQKVGLDDALAAGKTLDLLAATSTEHLRIPAPINDGRPELDVSVLERGVALAAFGHLAKGEIYRVGGRLVGIRSDDGALVVKQLGAPQLRSVLDGVVRCIRQTDDGQTPCFPPRDLADLMANDPDPPVPPLRGVASAPTFTCDGRLLDKPGYDAGSQLFLAFDGKQRPVPMQPNSDDLAEARRLWDEELLEGFCLATPSDRTAAVALALTPLVRELIDGPTPLFSVEAPVRGAGKGKLVAACLIPTLLPGGWTSASLSHEDEELRKSLTAYLAERRRAIVFDNVKGKVQSPVLAKVLTDRVWDDRVLGRSESVRSPVRCVWCLTANNPSWSDEIGRRMVPIRLVPETDRPELRSGFRHPELEKWVTEVQADLLWALAIFVRTWLAAGRPAPLASPLASYEAWSRVVGGVLEAAGYTHFLVNREEMLAAADPETVAWEGFTMAWWDQRGANLVAVKDLIELAETYNISVNGDGERARTASLGRALGTRRDRFFGPYQILQGRGRARREWQLRGSVTPRDTCDTSPLTLLQVAHAHAGMPPSGEAGEDLSHLSRGVTETPHDPLARAWGAAGEAEQRVERAGIASEGAA